MPIETSLSQHIVIFTAEDFHTASYLLIILDVLLSTDLADNDVTSDVAHTPGHVFPNFVDEGQA